MSDNNVISVAMLSALSNSLLQVLVRIISALSNAIIFRFISKEALGVINVRLLLLYSTCHCFSREAFRRSCLSTFDQKTIHQKFNLLWMIVPVCLICSSILRYIWLYVLEEPNPNEVSSYYVGVNVVIISVLIESFAEPIYVFSQSCHFVKLKAINEGLMLTVRSVCMVLCLSRWPHQAMYCFSFSQILSSIVYTCSYYGYFSYYLNKHSPSGLLINSLQDTFPKISKNFINVDDLKLAWSFFKQTLLKQFLTEGERYLMTFFSLLSFAEQGIYDVVNNLGSLPARFIFLSIEDSAYLLFTQLLPRNKPQSQEVITSGLFILGNILKLMVLIGATILFFGIPYSQLLLYVYGKTELSSGIGLSLMRWQCGYTFLLAINGISEGFKFAVMTRSEIDRYNKNLILLSIVFLLASYALVSVFGSIGFILANCLNMLLRTVHSSHYIEGYFKISKLELCRKIKPDSIVLLVLLVTLCCTSITEAKFCCVEIKVWIWHLLFGGLCFLFYLLIVWHKEKSLLSFVRKHWSSTASKQKLS